MQVRIENDLNDNFFSDPASCVHASRDGGACLRRPPPRVPGPRFRPRRNGVGRHCGHGGLSSPAEQEVALLLQADEVCQEEAQSAHPALDSFSHDMSTSTTR